MKVQFLEATDVERSLEALLAEYDEVYWAVAWGTANSLSGSLLSHSGKFRAVTFGLSFAQTDPDLIDLFVGVPGCYVVSEFPGGTFHPKVYAFRSGERAAAIIGSANFTRGGMGNNHEASILIAGTINDQVLADALAYAARSAELGNSVTEGLALRYRLSYELAARK
ncbi:MAG: phospholipase D family protein, partial [Rhizobiales bacterium]|nr:phospholipase D family protein [Hyphomicrobiales bacterium]